MSFYLCVTLVSFCEVFLHCVLTELQGIFAGTQVSVFVLPIGSTIERKPQQNTDTDNRIFILFQVHISVNQNVLVSYFYSYCIEVKVFLLLLFDAV